MGNKEMKINFSRRGVNYSVLKENALRIVDTKVIEKIETMNISVKIIDGQPTFLIEPFQIFFSGFQASKCSNPKNDIFFPFEKFRKFSIFSKCLKFQQKI